MRISGLLLAGLAVWPLWGEVVCSDAAARLDFAREAVLAHNGERVRPGAYGARELKMQHGYAYLFYFNTYRSDSRAVSVLVVLDQECGIRYVEEGNHPSDLVLAVSE